MTAISQLFLLENLSLSQHFLSLQDPSAGRHVIATDLEGNRRFFGEVMGVERLDLLPQMMAWIQDSKAPPPDVWWRWLEQLRADAARIEALVGTVPTTVPVYWLHAMGPLHLYAVLGRLRARGNPILFPSSPLITGLYRLAFHRNRQDFPDMHPDMPAFIQAASTVTGCDLGMVQVQPHDGSWSYFGIGPVQTDPPWTIAPKPWADIATVLSPRLQSRLGLGAANGMPRILLIDDQVADDRGMRAMATMSSLNSYLVKSLAEGAEIHTKPHYQGSDRTATYAPEIQARLRSLPYYIPAELLLDLFDEVIFFKSSTMSTPTKAKRTCLLPLIQFSNDETRVFYWKLLRSYLRPYWNLVSFVAHDGNQFNPRPVDIDAPVPPWCG